MRPTKEKKTISHPTRITWEEHEIEITNADGAVTWKKCQKRMQENQTKKLDNKPHGSSGRKHERIVFD